jgi:polynucleotide 5'-kinase involved in rRNA processing
LTIRNRSFLWTYDLPCHGLSFVGSVSPKGYLLQTLVATKKMVDKARRKGAKTVLVDTTGLVSESAGFQLKLNKIALLEPRHIVAFQHQDELEALLSVLSHWPTLSIHRLPVSQLVRPRSRDERYRYRVNRFRAYFREATRIRLGAGDLTFLSPPYGMLRFTVEPLPSVVSLDLFSSQSLKGYLVGLNDASNETLALGLLDAITPHGKKIDVLTPLRDTARARIIQMSIIRLAKSGEELDRPESEPE